MMKKSIKCTAVILSVVMLSAVIAVIAAWQNFADGNRILVNPGELPSVSVILDDIGIPYGTGNTSYVGKEYAFIESRAELMPIIENCLRESEALCGGMMPVYRLAHTVLFWTVICSGGLVSMCCVVMSLTAKNKSTAYLFITAAFLIAIGGMYWLEILTLSVV